MEEAVIEFQRVLGVVVFYWRWLVGHLRYGNSAAGELSTGFKGADPLAEAIAVALLLSAVVFLLSLPTNNHSWVDKLWSIVPFLYIWNFALHDRLTDPTVPLNARLMLMAVLATVWGCRLTYNFARKGGYALHAEDYRWPIIRTWLAANLPRAHHALFFIFNLGFISIYQNLLLLWLATPAYVAWQHTGTPLNGLDALAAGLVAFFILYESIADQQQWNFQTAKYAKLAAGKRLTGEYARGFITSGLFRYSRHPNFWAEQSLWCAMYLFSVAASGKWLSWTGLGAVQLILLFQGSTWLTELISAQKYPAYEMYQRTTSCFFPWIPAAATRLSTAGKAPRRVSGRRSSSRTRGEAAATPAVATDDEAEAAVAAAESEGEQEAAAAAVDGDASAPSPAPATSVKRRGRAARLSKAAAPEQQTEAEAEVKAAPPVDDSDDAAAAPAPSRQARSPKKSARARAAAEAAPAPTRQSSRLRAKARAAAD